MLFQLEVVTIALLLSALPHLCLSAVFQKQFYSDSYCDDRNWKGSLVSFQSYPNVGSLKTKCNELLGRLSYPYGGWSQCSQVIGDPQSTYKMDCQDSNVIKPPHYWSYLNNYVKTGLVTIYTDDMLAYHQILVPGNGQRSYIPDLSTVVEVDCEKGTAVIIEPNYRAVNVTTRINADGSCNKIDSGIVTQQGSSTYTYQVTCFTGEKFHNYCGHCKSDPTKNSLCSLRGWEYFIFGPLTGMVAIGYLIFLHNLAFLLTKRIKTLNAYEKYFTDISRGLSMAIAAIVFAVATLMVLFE